MNNYPKRTQVEASLALVDYRLHGFQKVLECFFATDERKLEEYVSVKACDKKIISQLREQAEAITYRLRETEKELNYEERN